jgi:hypothetical protein
MSIGTGEDEQSSLWDQVALLNYAQLGPNMRLAVTMLITLMQPVTLAPQAGVPSGTGYVISGRVDDPHRLRPEAAILMLGRQTGPGSFSSTPVPVGANGAFVTAPVEPGTYVLEVIRTPHSATKPATVVGLTLVRVDAADVAGVTVVIRRDTAITGTFRMESDNPAAVWPPHMVVDAFLALDGAPLLHGQAAEGASGGKFVLRNAFGPRVLRSGYLLAPAVRGGHHRSSSTEQTSRMCRRTSARTKTGCWSSRLRSTRLASPGR